MKPGSRISFEQFMAYALHDPQHGYYARRISAVGGRGDFTTAPMLSESPARAIAAWAAEAMRESKCRDLIEIGPGEGMLAAGVLRHLPWHTRWKTRMHLVESSVPLREKQQKLLGKRASFHSTMQDALDACGGNAVIYSNELVDAFPVRRFKKTEDGWQELEVEMHAGALITEHLRAGGDLPNSSIFNMNFQVGQWVEVHDSYRMWLHDWMPRWKSGRILTIDYGAEVERMYQRQTQGSIRAYLLQHRLTGAEIYQNVGRQDLTTDVNFTDLMNWSEPWCKTEKCLSFHDFLKAHSRVGDAHEKALLNEQGPGEAFRVLDQKRSG